MALQSVPPLKSVCWLRYIDDTFTIWVYGEEELSCFLDDLNGVHPRIQFTVEKETHGQLAFLDVLVTKKIDGGSCESNHHLRQKHAIMKPCEPGFACLQTPVPWGGVKIFG